MKNIEGFVVKWLLLTVFTLYYFIIMKSESIGFNHLTAVLVSMFVGCLVWELIKLIFKSDE